MAETGNRDLRHAAAEGGGAKARLATGDKTTAILTIIKVSGQPLGANPEIGGL